MWSSSGSRVGMTRAYYVWAPDPSSRSEGSEVQTSLYMLQYGILHIIDMMKSCMSYLLTVQRLSAVLSQYQKKYLPLNTEDGV